MLFLSDINVAKFRQPNQPLKDKKGGLTAAGRRYFRKKQGSRLRPGVMKKQKDMSLEDMRRKGSWSRRFYGRKKLPPLVKSNGEPSRHSLSAAAWGERPPKTEKQARAIAAKGTRLLKRYHRLKNKK